MPKGVYAAASAMFVESQALETVSRNLVNLKTPGYRQELVTRDLFADVLRRQGQVEADRDSIARDGGAGVIQQQRSYRFTEGNREPTDHPFDFALSGPGFFRVRDDAGTEYLTRGGHFDRDARGRLRTPEGHLLVGQGGPVSLPADANQIIVARDGTVSAVVAGQGAPVPIDRVRLAEVDDPQKLESLNGVLFLAGDAQVREAGPDTMLHQGQLERANVEGVAMMVEMIELQRRHDAAQKALTTQANLGGELSEIART